MRLSLHRMHIPLIALAITIFSASNAMACGSVAMHTERYWDSIKFVNSKNLIKAKGTLYILTDCHVKYEGDASDKQLLPVVLDAYDRRETFDWIRDRVHGGFVFPGATALLVEKIYRLRNCLTGAQGDKGYARLKEIFGPVSCTIGNLESNAQLHISDPLGANVRSEPSVNGHKITALKVGTPVRNLGIIGDWMKVHQKNGVVGYVHASLIK